MRPTSRGPTCGTAARRRAHAAAGSVEVAAVRQRRPRRGVPVPGLGWSPGWAALVWLGPALLLIIGVVIYPAIQLVKASFNEYSITGLRRGPAGWSNYAELLQHPQLGTVLKNTVVWVVAVVVLTVLIGLGVAQFLAKEFAGRRLVRWAIIVPWAASLVITARLFTLIYDYNYGILNSFLVRLNIVETPIDFLGDDRWTMYSMIAVGVFVSVPFTAYVFLAGLSGIPEDVYEAARMDGAGPWQTYAAITLPLLRPAILVAAVLNLIYVFNSFPIVYTLNERNPGFIHDTSVTFAYKLAFKSAEKDVGMSAATGVFNVLFILVLVLLYLRVAKPQQEV